MRKLLLAFLLLPLHALASVTMTVDVSAVLPTPPAGAYVNVVLVNCPNASIYNSNTVLPQSYKFYLNGQTSITFTIPDNVTQTACSTPTILNGATNFLSYYTFSAVSSAGTVLLKSVELPAGTFFLANLAPVSTAPYQPGATVGPKGLDGPSAVGYYDENTYPGTTLRDRIQAWDTAMGSAQGVMVNLSHGGTISGTLTLSQGHGIHIIGNPVAIATAVVVSGNNEIKCDGIASSITSTIAISSGIFSTTGAVSTISFDGCYFIGSGSVPWIFQTNYPVMDFKMNDVHGLNATIFNLVDRTAISKHLSFVNVSSVCSPSCGVDGTYFNGQYDGVQFTNSYWEGVRNGVYVAPIFINITKPSLTTIIAAKGTNVSVDNIRCLNMQQTCVFTSGAYKVTVQNGTANGCGDICFDGEGSAYVQYGPGLMAEDCGNSCFNIAYSTGYYNSVRGNTIVLKPGSTQGIMTNNDGGIGATSFIAHTVIDGNTITCQGGVYSAILLDATSFTSFTNNKVTDCVLSYRANQQGMTISNNTFHFTQSTGGASGLTAPPSLYGYPTYVTGNTIESDVGQSGACFGQVNNDFNNIDTFHFDYNFCSPNFATTALLANTGGNSGIGVLWRFRNNEFPNMATFTNTGSNANGYITRKGNCTRDTSSGPIPPLCDATP